MTDEILSGGFSLHVCMKCSIQLYAIGTSQLHYDVTLLTSLHSNMSIVMLLTLDLLNMC